MDALQFKERLHAIVPTGDRAHILAIVDLIDRSDDLLGNPVVAPAIFSYLERYPSADFGFPGPLIYYLEFSYPGYFEALIASLDRRPVSQTLWVANRMLNSGLGEPYQTKLIQAMEQAARHALISEQEKNRPRIFCASMSGANRIGNGDRGAARFPMQYPEGRSRNEPWDEAHKNWSSGGGAWRATS